MHLGYLHGNYDKGTATPIGNYFYGDNFGRDDQPSASDVSHMLEYEEGLAPGDAHYKSFVGHPKKYGSMGALQFSLLASLGLSEESRVLEVGCGALRLGKLLISFLVRLNDNLAAICCPFITHVWRVDIVWW
jgi:hypothetical protein